MRGKWAEKKDHELDETDKETEAGRTRKTKCGDRRQRKTKWS